MFSSAYVVAKISVSISSLWLFLWYRTTLHFSRAEDRIVGHLPITRIHTWQTTVLFFQIPLSQSITRHVWLEMVREKKINFFIFIVRTLFFPLYFFIRICTKISVQFLKIENKIKNVTVIIKSEYKKQKKKIDPNIL